MGGRNAKPNDSTTNLEKDLIGPSGLLGGEFHMTRLPAGDGILTEGFHSVTE